MAQIKKDTSLRKAILQAAITGQLVTNVEGESLPLAPASKLSSATPSAGASPATPPETGKELLDRIIEERNNKLLAEWEESLLIFSPRKSKVDEFSNENSRSVESSNDATSMSLARKNKKTKKPAPIVASEIDEEEIPFEIPENWCWCRLGDIILLLSGQDFPPEKYSDVEESVPYITGASNIEDNHVIINRWTKFPTVISKRNDILLVCKGSGYGKVVIADFDQAHIARQIMAIRASDTTLRKWIFLFLQNKFSYFKTQGNGLIPGIARNVVLDLLIPLPPLAVQNAIVAKLEQVLPLVDAYENALLQKEELKSALPDKVKKAILQEAITGQLTESWRKSATIKESGKQLLDRIIEERNAKALAEWEEALKKNVGGKATLSSFASKTRAKKPVPVVASEIEEEDIPFEVPESWCWCRLGDLASIARGGSPRPINDFLTNEPDGYNWIKISDTDKGGKYINGTKQKIKKEGLYKTRLIHKGDFLLTNSMSFGRPYISNIDGCIHDGWLVFSFINELINPDFIYNLLSSPFIYDSFSQSAAGGVVQNLNTDKVIDTLVPLPPLEEQKEIVKKLEELLPLCK